MTWEDYGRCMKIVSEVLNMFQAMMWGPETISINATQDDSGGKKMKKSGRPYVNPPSLLRVASLLISVALRIYLKSSRNA